MQKIMSHNMQMWPLDKSLITPLTPHLHRPGGTHKYLNCVRVEIYGRPRADQIKLKEKRCMTLLFGFIQASYLCFAWGFQYVCLTETGA